jgi:uncharacterized membrane protein YphA (DoxX/SURF4 family)
MGKSAISEKAEKFLAWRRHAWLSLPLRWYIGWVFLYACYHKILHPESFALDIATYQILPLYLVNLMALILPWVELAAGLSVIAGWKTRAASLLIAGMLAVFIVAIALALWQGLSISCGCFASEGILEDPISLRTIFRDVGWLLIPAYVILFDRNPLGIDRLLAGRERAKR